MKPNNLAGKKRLLLISVGILVVVLAVVIGIWAIKSQNENPDHPDATDPPKITVEDDVTEGTEPVTEDGNTVPDHSETSAPTETSKPTEPDPTEPVKPTEPEGTEPTDPDPTQPSGNGSGGEKPTAVPEQEKLVCEKIATFSGRFVEDGTDTPVENVAAILVTNHSDQFLDLANIVYDIDGKTGTFMVTGLPAGRSAWVMEYTGMTVTSESDIEYRNCTTSLRDDVVSSSGEISIEPDGNMLKATNNTDRTLENVFVYYKSMHTDGNYFGGITYMVEFGTLEPGASVEKLGGHFSVEESEIVRIGWQESRTDDP